jgi:y4mF family transcriptional regulator
VILVVYFSFILYFCSKSHCIVNTKEIGIIIKKRRQHLKVRQQELADLSGVGINTLVAIERGQGNPKLETLLAILDTLGLQVEIKLKD